MLAQQVFVAFSSVLACAINTCGDTLCSSAEHAGYDHRLGAYEALSAIISPGPKEALESQCRGWISGGLWCCLLPLSSMKFAVPWPTTIPGSRITARPQEVAVCQKDHVVGSVRRHLVHRSVDDGAGAVRAHEGTRARVPLQETHEER